MKVEKYLGLTAAILGVITFVDQYILKSNLSKSLSIPESIPTSIFLIVLAIFCFIFFFASRKEIALPYPDQRKDVQNLNEDLKSYMSRVDELSIQNEELLSIKDLFNGNEYLQDKIHGVLLKGSISSDNILRELKIDPNNSEAVANFQALIGRMGKQGLISATALGHYKLS